jgi:hypothetical protein
MVGCKNESNQRKVVHDLLIDGEIMQRKSVFIFSFWLLAALLALAADPAPGVLSVDDIKKVVPPSYFFRGQSAPVQIRNSVGFRTADGKLVLAGLVDTSGYSSDVAEKYQGFLITEVKLNLEGTELSPGQYGFGFGKDGKFLVMDVGANDLFSVASHLDDKLHRPVPLTIVADQGSYRLYAGKKWVSLKVQ